MDDPRPTILKRDALGRMAYSTAQRTALLDEFERGGLSAAAFARRVGVHYQTFASWVQKRRHARDGYQMRAANIAEDGPPLSPAVLAPPQAPPRPAVRLLEAVAENPGLDLKPAEEPQVLVARSHAQAGARPHSQPDMCVELRCGTRLLVGDARQAVLAAQLIQALNTALPC